jgi:hypothetical protein
VKQKKERTLTAVRENHQIIYKGKLIRIAAMFSAENLTPKRVWNESLKENNYCICKDTFHK